MSVVVHFEGSAASPALISVSQKIKNSGEVKVRCVFTGRLQYLLATTAAERGRRGSSRRPSRLASPCRALPSLALDFSVWTTLREKSGSAHKRRNAQHTLQFRRTVPHRMRRFLARGAAEAARASSLGASRVAQGDSSPLSRAAEACCSAAASSSSSFGGDRIQWRRSSSGAGPHHAIGSGLPGAWRRRVHADATQSSLDDVGAVDPFSLVTDELSGVSERMRRAVVSEVRDAEQSA